MPKKNLTHVQALVFKCGCVDEGKGIKRKQRETERNERLTEAVQTTYF